MIDESQAKRLEEVAVHLDHHHQQQQQAASKKKKGRGEFLKDHLEAGEDKEEGKAAAVLSDNAPSHSKWYDTCTRTVTSRLGCRIGRGCQTSPAILENHSAAGLCATLESFGGLSLKAAQAFAKASVIKFRIQTPPERFFINTKTGKVQPGK